MIKILIESNLLKRTTKLSIRRRIMVYELSRKRGEHETLFNIKLRNSSILNLGIKHIY